MVNKTVIKYGIISKLRPGFWLKQVAGWIALQCLIAFCCYLSYTRGPFNFQNGLLWVALLLTIGLFALIIKFLLYDLRTINITDQGIVVKYIFTGKIRMIFYKDIKQITPKTVSTPNNSGSYSRYYRTEIELADDELFCIDEDQFDNYSEMKNSIINFVKELKAELNTN